MSMQSVSNPPDDDLDIEAAPAAEIVPGKRGTAPIIDSSFAQLLVGGQDDVGGPAAPPVQRTRTVFGPDERVRILDTKAAPWRMICALGIEGSTASFVGSGALIGPKTVLTAGHCVFHKALMGGWAKRITVIPGRNGADFPFGSTVATRFVTLDDWTERQDPDFDVAVIRLEEPIGDATGTFAFASLPKAELKNARVNISGYPADRGYGEEQYFHADQVTSVGPHRVFYQVDTYGGQSGAPVWTYRGDDRTNPIQVAIHAYGVGGATTASGAANSAPRITPELLRQIKAWLAEDGG